MTSTPTPTVTLAFTATRTASSTPTPAVANTLVVFPNPATGPGPVTLQFTLAAPAGSVEITLYTLAFRRVNRLDLVNLPAGKTEISLALTDSRGTPLANGLYYVVVRTPQGRLMAKLMVLR